MKFPSFKTVARTAACVLAIGVTSAVLWNIRPTPERLLYSALEKTDLHALTREESEGIGYKIAAKSIYTKDNTAKGEAAIGCQADTVYGALRTQITMRLYNETQYFRIDSFELGSDPDDTEATELNAYFKNEVVGKWVELGDKNPSVATLRQEGLMFNYLGASGDELDSAEMVKKLKQSGAITIHSSKPVTRDGKEAVEYTLAVGRTAYRDFMDSIERDLEYENEIIEALFTSDTQDVNVVVDTQTRQVIEQTYTMENLCLPFVDIIDPSATVELSPTVRVTAKDVKGVDIPEATKPDTDDIMTMREFQTVLYGEDEE